MSGLLQRLAAAIDGLMERRDESPEAERFERELNALMAEWLALPEAERIARIQRVHAVVATAGLTAAQALRGFQAFSKALAEAERPAHAAEGRAERQPLLITSQAEMDAAYGTGFMRFPTAISDPRIPVTLHGTPRPGGRTEPDE